MLTLIHAPLSRSSRIIWLLEELGAEYEIRYVDIRRWDGSGGPDENNPHPHKQVPALLHDGTLIWESVAVVQYLISKGISAQRLVAAGFGEFQPLDAERTDDAFRRNRRIELKLTER